MNSAPPDRSECCREPDRPASILDDWHRHRAQAGEHWDPGLAAERMVATALNQLHTDLRWYVRQSVNGRKGGDIDHLLAVGNLVFVCNTKAFPYRRVHLEHEGVQRTPGAAVEDVDRRPYEQVRRQASDVATALVEANIYFADVIPVLVTCRIDPHWKTHNDLFHTVSHGHTPRDIEFVNAAGALRELRRLGKSRRELPTEKVADLRSALCNSFPHRRPATTPSSLHGADPSPS